MISTYNSSATKRIHSSLTCVAQAASCSVSHLLTLTCVSYSMDQKQDMLVYLSNWPRVFYRRFGALRSQSEHSGIRTSNGLIRVHSLGAWHGSNVFKGDMRQNKAVVNTTGAGEWEPTAHLPRDHLR